jgi:hypothetical protein
LQLASNTYFGFYFLGFLYNLFDFKLLDFYNFYKTKNAPAVCVREEKDINLLKRVELHNLT